MLTSNSKPSLYRDFIVLSAVILVVMLVVSAWITERTWSAHSQDIIEQLQNAAVRIDRTMIIEIERASYLLESVARQVAIVPGRGQSDYAETFTGLQLSERGNGYEFFRTDARQRVFVSSLSGVLPAPVDLSDRDYMKQAITSPWQVHIGRPVEGRITGDWVIPAAIGMTNAKGDYTGTVTVSIPVKRLTNAILNVIDEETVSFAVTTGSFSLMTESGRYPGFFDKHFNTTILAERILGDNRTGVYSQPPLPAGKEPFSYYEYSSQYPFILFLGYNADASTKEVLKLLFPRLLQLIVIAAFLILILWVVRKRIIHPVWVLAGHAREIMRSGQFQHDPSDDPAEIVELSDAIRQLSHYFTEQKRIEAELSLKNRELNKIREAAEITNRVKADFFEQVGESLMRPAITIEENAESMRSELFGPLGNPKYTEVAETIQDEVKQIREILEDITMISRAESGLLALNDAPLDVHFIIKKCLRLLRDKPPFAMIEIISDVDDDLPGLAADELRIKQVLINLLMSVARQSDVEDMIRISARMRREKLVIEIQYHPVRNSYGNAGNHEETRQPQPARHREMIGATSSFGLGFALSQLIVAMHEGELLVKHLPDGDARIELVFPEKRIVR